MKTKQTIKDQEETELEFLRESNHIEREYSEEALEDAIKAWEYAKKAFAKKSKDAFSIKGLLKIHALLLKRLAPHYAGKIRECAVYIGGECRSQNKMQIVEELNSLFEQWNNHHEDFASSQEAEEFIKKWHIKYEACHPFADGNGRTGRILMNLQRLKVRLPLLIIHEGIEQFAYYKWFRSKYEE